MKHGGLKLVTPDAVPDVHRTEQLTLRPVIVFVRKQAARQPYSTSSGEAGDSWSSCSGCHQDYEGPHDADCPVAGAQAVLGCNCNQEDATEECPLHGAATQPPAPPVGTGGTTP